MLISFMPLSDSSNLLKQLYVSSTPELLESHFLVRPVGLQFLFNSSYSRVSRRNLHLTAWRRGLELKQARGLADHRAVDRPVRQPPARFPPPRATPGFRRLPVWCTRLHCSKFATCQIIVRTSRALGLLRLSSACPPLLMEKGGFSLCYAVLQRNPSWEFILRGDAERRKLLDGTRT